MDVQTPGSPGNPGNPGNIDRHAQLVLAAQALSAWIHDRQAEWGDAPLDVTAVPAMAPQAPVPSETWGDQPVPRVAVAKRAPQLVPRIATLARALREPFAQSARRIAIAAAVVAFAGGAGLAARSYWLKWAALPKVGTATLESTPAGSEVLIDGAGAGTAPLTATLAPGRHVVEFRQNGAARTVTIDVAAGQSTVGRVDWNAKRTGRLRVESTPDGARVIVDGRDRGVTPVTVENLTAGSHAVVLESAAGSVRRSAAIDADRTTEMAETIYSGWLHVSAPIELVISEAGKAILLDEHNQALLPPGRHEIRVENRALAYQGVFQVEVQPGKTASISVAPAPSTLTVTASAPGDVLIDGQRVGETPLTNYAVNLGTRDIVVRSASGLTRRFVTTVTSAPVRIDVDFSKP